MHNPPPNPDSGGAKCAGLRTAASFPFLPLRSLLPVPRLPRQIQRQRPHIRADRFCNLAEGQEGEVPLAAFDTADVAAVNPALEGQILLRPVQNLAPRADAVAEDSEWGVVLHFGDSLKTRRLSVHGLCCSLLHCGVHLVTAL